MTLKEFFWGIVDFWRRVLTSAWAGIVSGVAKVHDLLARWIFG